MKKPTPIDPRVHQLKAVNRLIAAQEARDHLMPYIALTMPDPGDAEDAKLSRYESTPQGRLLCEIIEKVERGELKRVCISIGPQMGKALQVDTPIPTPAGWCRIVDLKVGDTVFSDTGASCRVIAKTPIWKDRPVIEVSIDDGFTVIADEEHEWPVRMSRSYKVIKNKTTKKLLARKAERNVLLAIHGAIETPTSKLPIDPYVLGLWLGDGTSDCGAVTAVGEDGIFVESQVRAAGYETRRRTDTRSFGILGLHKVLRTEGLLGNKHIPAPYLRASKEQRLALLQGLMDSDGYADPSGNLEFCNTNLALAEGTRELIVSLGVRCSVYVGRALLYGKDCGVKYRLHFMMKNAARLPRKRALCKDITRCGGRYLKFKPAGIADTVCIEVDSPSHQFLCGKGMVVTCNSEVISRSAPAWIAGRNPYRNMILGSYNQDFANEFGFEVRNKISTPAHKQIFPNYELMKGGTAKDLLVSKEGGKLAFVGVGGSGTGKPADLFVVDDPFRNDEDANSASYRERVWKWFQSTVFSRTTDATAIVIVHTRWHQDDLIGRLCDPSHPERDGLYKGIAKRWTYINIPAVVEDEALAKALGLNLKPQTDPDILEQFGSAPMSALWPGRKSLPLLAEAKQSDPRTFNALYMGKPAPETGEYFKSNWILEYEPKELPKKLRMYGASDHAVSTKQRRDYTCVGCVGIDENDEIWVMPDVVWKRMDTQQTVEELLGQFTIHRPALWWLENEMISKSFGPFLVKRMREDRIYTTLDPITPTKDLETRARSIQGRMAMQMVHFPRQANWWQNARTQILTFPYATNDDFVSWLALVGLGLTKELKPATGKKKTEDEPPTGSIQWILKRAEETMRKSKRENAIAGW